MAKPEKQQVVAELAEKIEAAKMIVLTDFTGMDVLSISELRKKCREAKVEYRVIKNTLTRLAAQKTRYSLLSEHLDGPTALAISAVDEIAPARVINEFLRQHELPRIKSGFAEGRLLEPKEVQRLALLPPKNVLLGYFAGTLRRPVASLVYVLAYKIKELVRVLDEVRKTKTQ
ncbi:MAG: 50S ribosomal protein L10 [Candidatus Eisenbacteria bacterium]